MLVGNVMMFEGSPLSEHEARSCRNLVFGGSKALQCKTRTMMHACASATRLRGGGPILDGGIEAMTKRGNPPPRTVIASPSDMTSALSGEVDV
jgi:hypothetical protein